MRLENFESANSEPLGEGFEKKVFVDPTNEKRVISERKEWIGKDTPRQLKGRYYLTKIAHLLLPKNIPDIHQVRETIDGQQTVDVERIPHTEGHTLLQKLYRSNDRNEGPAVKKIIAEIGDGMNEVDLELSRIGLGFNVDDHVGNYSKNEKGDVYYLETFKPWQFDIVNKNDLEVLFNEEELRDAINAIPDEEIKRKSINYLERLLALMAEEKQELQNQPEATLASYVPQAQEVEAMLSQFMSEPMLAILHLTRTADEAMNSTERTSAKQLRDAVFSKLKILQEETDIPKEEYDKLYEKYLTLSRAIGTINRGVVDHTR
jgi:hypothetical protein